MGRGTALTRQGKFGCPAQLRPTMVPIKFKGSITKRQMQAMATFKHGKTQKDSVNFKVPDRHKTNHRKFLNIYFYGGNKQDDKWNIFTQQQINIWRKKFAVDRQSFGYDLSVERHSAQIFEHMKQMDQFHASA